MTTSSPRVARRTSLIQLSNSDEGASPRSRGAMRPEFCVTSTLFSEQRAQGKPGARCTRGLVCNLCEGKRTRAYRSSGGNPAFPARWFTAYFGLSPVTGLLPPSSLRSLLLAKLSASTGAPGPHVLIYASRRIPPNYKVSMQQALLVYPVHGHSARSVTTGARLQASPPSTDREAQGRAPGPNPVGELTP